MELIRTFEVEVPSDSRNHILETEVFGSLRMRTEVFRGEELIFTYHNEIHETPSHVKGVMDVPMDMEPGKYTVKQFAEGCS